MIKSTVRLLAYLVKIFFSAIGRRFSYHKSLWSTIFLSAIALVDDFPIINLSGRQFLESKYIRRTNWLVISPDVNPVEYNWDAMWRANATGRLLREPSKA